MARGSGVRGLVVVSGFQIYDGPKGFEMKQKIKELAQSSLVTKHKEKIKFGLVGGLNTALDFVIFGLLANVLGVFVVVANLVSTAICMVVSFGLNYKFVWRSKKSMRETAPQFVLVSLFSAWVVQSVTIWAIVGIFGESDVMNLVAKVVGIGLGMICNYLGYKMVFR